MNIVSEVLYIVLGIGILRGFFYLFRGLKLLGEPTKILENFAYFYLVFFAFITLCKTLTWAEKKSILVKF